MTAGFKLCVTGALGVKLSFLSPKTKTRTPDFSVCVFDQTKIKSSGFRFRLQLGGAFRINADEFAFLSFVFEFDEAFDQSEQRIVFAAADVFARLPFRAALARQNVAAENVLAAEFLESQSLGVRIAPVS
jgi:hypothetical protein